MLFNHDTHAVCLCTAVGERAESSTCYNDEGFRDPYWLSVSPSTRPGPTSMRLWARGWSTWLRTSSRCMWRVWGCSSFRRTSDPSARPCVALCCGAWLRPWPSQTPLAAAGPSSALPRRRSSPSCPTKSRCSVTADCYHWHVEAFSLIHGSVPGFTLVDHDILWCSHPPRDTNRSINPFYSKQEAVTDAAVGVQSFSHRSLAGNELFSSPQQLQPIVSSAVRTPRLAGTKHSIIITTVTTVTVTVTGHFTTSKGALAPPCLYLTYLFHVFSNLQWSSELLY